LRTVQNCIDEGENLFIHNSLFFGHGTDNAADEALWIVFHQMQLSWESDANVLSKPVSDADYREIQKLFQRRVHERIPAAYLLGSAWFAGYEFIVNSDVLVPRSPLAECVRAGFSPWLDHNVIEPHILDLCTGCGCIGIAAAMEMADSRVVLSDISEEALTVAKQNIQKFNLYDRVDTVQSDLFENIASYQFDVIVTNPPYVDAQDFANMPSEYHAEPALALASGQDGLDFTRRLLKEAPQYMSDQGILICELGNSWENLEAAFPQVPFVWLEMVRGGHGIFVFSKEELLQYHSQFNAS
jgi:ribosomal protein L3 glutamine methyltransferase